MINPNKTIHNRKLNALLRTYDVQTEYRKVKNDGVPDAFVYRNYIYPRFRISLALFYEYLSVNVHQELKKIGVEPETVLT